MNKNIRHRKQHQSKQQLIFFFLLPVNTEEIRTVQAKIFPCWRWVRSC